MSQNKSHLRPAIWPIEASQMALGSSQEAHKGDDQNLLLRARLPLVRDFPFCCHVEKTWTDEL